MMYNVGNIVLVDMWLGLCKIVENAKYRNIILKFYCILFSK
jgi:hypothetical protein